MASRRQVASAVRANSDTPVNAENYENSSMNGFGPFGRKTSRRFGLDRPMTRSPSMSYHHSTQPVAPVWSSTCSNGSTVTTDRSISPCRSQHRRRGQPGLLLVSLPRWWNPEGGRSGRHVGTGDLVLPQDRRNFVVVHDHESVPFDPATGQAHSTGSRR